LTGGADASTAQDVVNAINKQAGSIVLAAIQSGSGGTVVALEDPNTPGSGKAYNDVVLTGASDVPGFTTGLAFANDERTLYGVTDQGQFLRQISTFTSVPLDVVPISLPDPFNAGSTLSGSNLRFSALALGPQNVEDGRYANTFFAMTDNGILTCLDLNGIPQKIFDTDGDGVADSTDILTGAFLEGGQANSITGLAFSPFDFNLWHPTFRRQGDDGHSAGDPDGLNTTRDTTLSDPASGRMQDSTNMSYYFGWEPFQTTPGRTTDSYQTYAGSGPFLGTGNVNLPSNLGQLGMLSATKQHELSLNPQFSTNSYNIPGAASGSLITGNFTLGGMSASDKPTFYFDYYLETEDANADAIVGSGNMRDSARVYIGPFTRFDNSGGPYVTGSVLDPTTTATATQFNGTAAVALSGIDGFYKGKALQFTSGALSGQTHIITDYIGATRTFVFAAGDSFTAAPTSGDAFRIAYGYQTWDLLATNNSVLDSPNSSPTREGELGTFVSASNTILPSNPRQQVQLMQDNTGQWRQTRVDLSKYAGMTNLQLRFDFSTAGQMPDSKGHLPLWPQDITPGSVVASSNTRGIYPPTSVAATPGQDYLYEDGFGNLTKATARQDNAHEGFYVDNIIVGPAERGEMVINAPVNTNFTDLATPGSITQPRNYDPFNSLPTQVLTGPYQLEIRRGAEYSLSDNGPLNDLNYSHNSQTPIIAIDTNDRLIPDQRLGAPIPVEGFETQNFTGSGLKWSFTDDTPWIITNSAATGSFAASSGKITNGQSSGLSIDLTTGAGDLTFYRSVDSNPGDVLRLFIDGRVAVYTQLDDVVLSTPQLASWSGSLNFQKVTVPIAAGHHNFRWTYDKDSSDPVNSVVQDRAVIDEIHFPTPQVGFENVYTDPSLNDSSNPNAVNPPIGPTIAPPNSFAQIHFIDTLFPGFTQGGDTNLDRAQGHIQIEMNKIYAAQQVGILIDAGPRQSGSNNPAGGAVRNLPTLNTNRLVPGVTVANNIVSNAGAAGIQYSGDANTAVNGVAVPLAAVPFGRIVNNTIYGGNTAAGTGILVTNNAGPTLLNNIVANTTTGISVDTSSTATTVIGSTLYSGNTSNVPSGGSTGTNPIILNPTDPLFIDAANQNFYPAPQSQAVDSAVDTLADRPSIAAVKSSIGIPQSPIITPEHDIYGQLRVDDPSQNTPPGLGQNVFKDRGAVERADFTQPTADVFVTDSDNVNIADDDSATPFRDRDRTAGNLAIRNTNLIQFVIQLSDDGVGIDDATVDNTKFVVTQDGIVLNDQFAAKALGVSADYQFEYNTTTDTVILSPSAGFWPLNHTYKILVNNTDGTSVDSLGNPIPAGVFDLAGNNLAANHATGELSFSIFVGTLYDFGDAPDPYPTTLANNGAAATVQDGYYLGTGISEESEAVQNADATADGDSPPNPNFSDGIVFMGNPAPNKNGPVVNKVTVTAHIPAGMTGKLDAWFDLNRDFDWNDAGEKITLTNITPDPSDPTKLKYPNAQPGDIFDGDNLFSFSFGDANTTKGSTFARFQLSPTGVSSPTFVTVNGVAPDGEVEDKQILVSSAPFQNPSNQFDVNNDGFVSAADALTIINVLNAHPGGTGKLELGQPPVPNPVGSAPGLSLYVDTTGDGFIAGDDVLAIINYINAHKTTGGEAPPEGEAPIETGATSQATNLSIPSVLLAAPNIVIDVQDKSPTPAVLPNQSATPMAAQDQALLALGSASIDAASIDANLSLLGPKTQSSESADEANWEDLITYLASEQQPKV
jgi:hypothetical protein